MMTREGKKGVLATAALLDGCLLMAVLAGCTDPIQLGSRPDAGGPAPDGGGGLSDGGGPADAAPKDWERVVVAGAEDIRWRSIHGDGSGRIWIAGEKATIAEGVGDTWTIYKSGVLDAFLAIHAAGPSEVYVAGEAGLIFRFDGTAWSSQLNGIQPWLEGEPTDVTFYAIWGQSDGEVLVASNAHFSVEGRSRRGVLRRYQVTEGSWDWFPNELEGSRPAFDGHGDLAIAADDLWIENGQHFQAVRKPFESEYNAFGDVWVTKSGFVYILAHPSSSDRDVIFTMTQGGWRELGGITPELGLLDLAGEVDSDRVFVCGYWGYLGELADGELRTIRAADQSLPPLTNLFVGRDQIWAVGDRAVVRLQR